MTTEILTNEKIEITSFYGNFGKSYYIKFKNGFTEKDLIKLIKDNI